MSVWARSLAELFWEARCAGCEGPAAAPGFCAACAGLLEAREGPRCQRCDADLPEPAPAHRCGRCLQRAPDFARAWGVFDYAGPVGDAIRGGKYGRRSDRVEMVARVLGGALPEALRADPPARILPVPSHPRRLRARGFSTPLILARGVARALHRPLGRRDLVRRRDTPEQAGLSEVQRQRNLKGAFEVRRLQAEDVLLVDDVLTTGATARELSRVVRRAGATRIRVLAGAYVASGV